MNKKTLSIIGATTVLGGLGFLGYYLYRQYQILRNICYEFSNLVFSGFDENTASIGLTMRTTNYSYLPLTIDGGMITVYIDGMPSAVITVPRGQLLPKAVTFSYLSARVDKVNLIAQGVGSLIDLLTGNNNKTITFSGTVRVRVGFMRVNFPIMYSDRIANIISSASHNQPCPPVIPLPNNSPYYGNKQNN
tara:strand:+ start:6247 stop:6819 length:573 start_codon:yes stop_codon:yes gene_type:complete